MPNVIGKIAHISDLHFGWRWWPAYFSRDLANHLFDHIKQQSPNLIICTGDLVDSSLALGLWRARRFLDRLQAACGDRCKICLVPGNHDVALLGVVGINRVTGCVFRWLMNRYLVKGFMHDSATNIVVFGFDSNPTISDFARGVITEAEITDFWRHVERLQGKVGEEYLRSFKIAALHHHPVPIPYSGSDIMLVLDNAASFMVELAKNNVDLILHGHKHYSGFSEVLYHLDEGDFRVSILSAGSATKSRDRGPVGSSYNLITVWDDGFVSAQVFVARRSGTFFPTGRRLVCRDTDTASDKAFRINRELRGYEVAGVNLCVDIGEFGDAYYTLKFDNLGVLEGRNLGWIEIKRRSDFGYFRDFAVRPLTEGLSGISSRMGYDQEKDGTCLWTVARSTVSFGTELTSFSSPTSFEVKFPLYAAFAMSRDEQEQRKSCYRPGLEGVAFDIEYPIQQLLMKIDARGYSFSRESVRLAIIDSKGSEQQRLEREALSHLLIAEHSISLEIRWPRAAHRYEIMWAIPESEEFPSPETVGDAQVLRRVLARSARAGSTSRLAIAGRVWLKEIIEDFHSRYGSSDPSEKLDISLMVFDEEAGRLKIGASLFPLDSPIWDWDGLRPGYGMAGRSLKINKVTTYFRRMKKLREWEIYIGPGDPVSGAPGLFQHEVLISIPLHLAGDSRHHIVGILNIGTDSPASPLYGILKPGADVKWSELKVWLAKKEDSLVLQLLDMLAGQSAAETP